MSPSTTGLEAGFPDLETAHGQAQQVVRTWYVLPTKGSVGQREISVPLGSLRRGLQESLYAVRHARDVDRCQRERAAGIASEPLFPTQTSMSALGTRGTWGRWGDQGQRHNRDLLAAPVGHPAAAQLSPSHVIPADGLLPQRG
jgi:hypothetical protein